MYRICKNHHNLILVQSYHPPKEMCSYAVPRHSHPQPLATTNLFSVSTVLSVLDITYKWNHTRCGLFCLTSFAEHNVFEVHTCCSMNQYFVSFYSQVVSQCMDVLHFVSLSHLWDSFGIKLFLSWDFNTVTSHDSEVYPVLNLDFQDIANNKCVLTREGNKGLRAFQIRFCQKVMISFDLCNISLTLYYLQYWRVSTPHDLWGSIIVNYFEKNLAPFLDQGFHVSLAWLILDHLLRTPPRPMLTNACLRSLRQSFWATPCSFETPPSGQDDIMYRNIHQVNLGFSTISNIYRNLSYSFLYPILPKILKPDITNSLYHPWKLIEHYNV